MQDNKRGSKRSVEKVLVAADDVSLPTDGTLLTNASTLDVNLTDGQIGLLDVTPGSSTFNQFFNNAGSHTFEEIPIMKVVQGTNTSADPGSALIPFTRRPYESSVDIIGKNVVAYTGKSFVQPYRSASVLAVSATPAEQSVYSIYLGFRGRRVTEFDAGIHAVVKKKVQVTTGQYSTLGLTSDTDDLVQRLCYQIDQNSFQFQPFFGNFGGSWKVMAFAVDASGGSGISLTLASSAGQAIPVVVTPDGITRSITTDADTAATFAQVVTNTALTGASTIELIDPSTYGTGTADYVLIMAMNESTAYIDRDPTLKIRIDAGAGDRFIEEGINFVTGSDPNEGQGTYRQWKIYFDNTNGQRSYSQNRDLYPVLAYPTSLDDSQVYDAIIIEHYQSSQVSFTGTSNSPHKTIILVPDGSTAATAIVDAFNDWLAPSFPPVSI